MPTSALLPGPRRRLIAFAVLTLPAILLAMPLPFPGLSNSVAGPPGALTATRQSALTPFGLQGEHVTDLRMYNRLYAGTLESGVFRLDLDIPDAPWESLGLEGKKIRTVYPHSSSALGYTTSVGLQGDPLHPDSALVYCAEFDQLPWVVSDSGMVRTDIVAVWSLDGFPSPAICGETFAGTIGSAGGVWRREFLSLQWEFVLDIGLGVCNVVRADPLSGHVWAGGENAILSPWLARSTDLGVTWNVVYPFLGGDNACNDLAFHPGDPDVAYAGMEGPVIKTTDGGQTWEYTGLDESQAYIYGVALDSAAPAHLLAGGTVTNPNNWALWESFDAGSTWTEIPPPSSKPLTTGIYSIVADPNRSGVFYISTQGDGVWRYESSAAGVPDPTPDPNVTVGLSASPNPFTTSTTLRLTVPTSLRNEPATLTLYNAQGQRIARLLDNAPIGDPLNRMEPQDRRRISDSLRRLLRPPIHQFPRGRSNPVAGEVMRRFTSNTRQHSLSRNTRRASSRRRNRAGKHCRGERGLTRGGACRPRPFAQSAARITRPGAKETRLAHERFPAG